LGTTKAAKMPMMAKTTINSIKVKPRCLRTAWVEFSEVDFMVQSLSANSDTSPS
jgi:hypothetical protein